MLNKDDIYETEEDFHYYCPCAFKMESFIENKLETDTRWFFHRCYCFREEKRYAAIFKSYDFPEYRDYSLSLEGTLKDGEYQIRVVQKIDGLSK
ncbi:hypothetical protein GWP49_35020 [Klebsiella pneumoniae]|nr:hypothetical protein [Klebsiella pneumoniae]